MRKGGRAKGTPNKLTTDVKKLLSDAVETHFFSDLNKLTSEKRIDVLVKLLPYLLPIQKNEDTPDQIPHRVIIVKRD